MCVDGGCLCLTVVWSVAKLSALLSWWKSQRCLRFSTSAPTVYITYTPFTWSSNHQANIKQTSSRHQANVEQTSSKYEACIKHSLHEANIKQTSSKHRASSSSQLYCVNGVLLVTSSLCLPEQNFVALIAWHEHRAQLQKVVFSRTSNVWGINQTCEILKQLIIISRSLRQNSGNFSVKICENSHTREFRKLGFCYL